MGEIEFTRLEHGDHVGVESHRIALDAAAVDAQEDIRRGEGDAFVAVDEGVVDGEAFQQRRGLGDDIVVIAGLRAEQGRFERAGVAQAGRAAVAADLDGVDGEDIGEGQPVPPAHFASSR